MTSEMTREELLALPVTVDLVIAARALGMGRTKAYELVRRGEFPVPVVKLGNRQRVVTERLLELLGVIRYSIPTIATVSRGELESRRQALAVELVAWRPREEIQAELDEVLFLLGEEG